MSEKTFGTVPRLHEDQVRITRVFDAAPERVFQAWTRIDQLERWYAPGGCTIRFLKLDARPGGTFHFCIRTADGHECWVIGEYREVATPARIVHTMVVSDAEGRIVDPLDAGMDHEWPQETVVTVTFARCDGGTRVTLQQTVAESLAKRTGAHPSWLSMLDRLAEVLSAAS